jgi:hypothetical protein
MTKPEPVLPGDLMWGAQAIADYINRPKNRLLSDRPRHFARHEAWAAHDRCSRVGD